MLDCTANAVMLIRTTGMKKRDRSTTTGFLFLRVRLKNKDQDGSERPENFASGNEYAACHVKR